MAKPVDSNTLTQARNLLPLFKLKIVGKKGKLKWTIIRPDYWQVASKKFFDSKSEAEDDLLLYARAWDERTKNDKIMNELGYRVYP